MPTKTYEPPWGVEELREHGYSEEKIKELAKDPVHEWRMQTGIELIHIEPTRTELMRIWSNWQLMSKEQKEISEKKCKELFGCTNKELYNYLLPQYKVEAPGKGVISYPLKESTEVLAEKAIHEGFLYHGSPNHYAVLKPQTQEDVNGKKVLSFSPFKSIASMFVIPVDRLIRGYHRCRLRYDEWFNMSKDKYQPLTTVHVYHNIKQLGDFEKVFSGYLYTVKAEDVLQNATDNPKWRGEKEVLAYASEIHPVKTEQISVKVVFKYDLKRCGTDHDAALSGTSEEALMTHKRTYDDIHIYRATNITDEQWKLITETVNLAAKASGDESWTVEEVKNKINKNKLEVYFILEHQYEASKTDRSFTETYHPLGVVQFNPSTRFISNFAIFKKVQGQGIGFLALKKFLVMLKTRYPNKDVYINVASTNTSAKALYTKVGFTKLSEEHGACRMVYKLSTVSSEEVIKDSVSSNIKNNLVYSEVEIKRKGEGSVEEYYYGMNPEDYIPDSEELSMEMMTIQNVSMEENVVQEQGTYVLIRGFPVAAFFKQLSKHYQTHKLENLIHVVHSIGIAQWTVNTRTVKIHRFFLPEIVYLLTKFNMSQTLIGDIQRGSWMGAPITNKTDCKVERISANMNCTLMPHQQTFVENYADLKDSHRLRGYLLSFGQGLGKTITAIALMEALGKERVVVICPKNTMVETWKSHFQRFYKKEQSIYVAGFDKKFNGERFCIFNYDAIDKLNALDGVKTSKMGIIVDESHNFLRIQAARTRKLIDLAKSSDDADVLLVSGTPIRSNGQDLVPLISMLDPLFDDEAAQIFKDSFGINTKIASEVLHARLKRMMERVTKDALNLPPKRRSVIKVKLPDGRKYTIKEVKKGMRIYINERLKFHRDHMVEYRQEFDECMRYLQTRPIAKTPEFQKYRAVIERLMKHGGRFDQGDEEVAWANAYEKTVVEREFPSELLQKFRHCKAAIKYLHLKVRGEVLGQFLAKLRIEMTTAMLKAVNIKQLIDEAEKKTIIFSSFIDTIETCEQHVRALGYKPIIIYGKNSSEIAPLAAKFQKDQSYNPLIASLQTLSTGATLTAANRVIFLNKPWRSIDYEQASDRVHRIGQDTAVDIISLVLDTGEEGNLSTRMEDIMDASARAFDAIVEERKQEEDKKLRAAGEDYMFDLLDLPDDILDEEHISFEGMTLLNDTKEQRTLNRLAKPHYRPRGANSWEHVQQDMANGILLVKKLKHRDLTLQEYATILYHDCGCKSMYPDKEGHGLRGVEIAKPELKKCGFFSEQEIEDICTAILEHDETTNPKNMHSSELSDLLASADTNPPDIPWILNKSYVWGLRHGITDHDKNIDNLIDFMKKVYGSDGSMVYPKLYKEYYKNEIKKMEKFFDNLTHEECSKIVTEYRKDNDLRANELTLPEPNTDQKITISNEAKSVFTSHDLYKDISFPKEEIATLRKQDRIVTTRVSNDFDMFAEGDMVKTPWNAYYKVSKRLVIHNVQEHPFYKQLTENQINLIKKYKDIAVLYLNKIKPNVYTLDEAGKPTKVNLFSDEALDANESLEPSMEAVKNIKAKRKKIQDYILNAMKLLDPHTDTNYKYWKNRFDSMTDKDFDDFMHYLREGKTNIHMFVPPFKVTLQTKEMLEAAHKLGVKIMHRIWMTDPHTGIKYLTPEEYMVLQLPVRRQQQFLDEKLSVPDNDKTIDGLTGQVTGDSKSCSITNPEIQILHARNLDATLYEFSNVRGGNIRNYAEFKRSLEETGSVKLEQLDPTNRTRVAVMGQVLLTAMHLDVNLVDI